MEHDAICCSGFQIWHNPTEEPSLDLDRTVLSQRRLWYRDRSYDKALLTSTPQRYSFGFHTAVPRHSPVGRLPVPLQPWTSHRWRLLRSASKRIVARSQLGVRDPDLLLLHLHSADFDLAHQKHRRVAHYSDYDDRFDHERTYARLTDDSFGQWYFKPARTLRSRRYRNRSVTPTLSDRLTQTMILSGRRSLRSGFHRSMTLLSKRSMLLVSWS